MLLCMRNVLRKLDSEVREVYDANGGVNRDKLGTKVCPSSSYSQSIIK